MINIKTKHKFIKKIKGYKFHQVNNFEESDYIEIVYIKIKN